MLDGVPLDLADHRLALGFHAIERQGVALLALDGWPGRCSTSDPSEVERVVTVTVTIVAANRIGPSPPEGGGTS